MDQDSNHHHPLPTSSIQSTPLQSSEVFVIVRPPPSKANHPLNLQVQLVLPTLPNSVHQTEYSSSDLRRTPSVRSAQSSRSNSSLLSITNSEASRRGRRVTPLYNLQCHTVLSTWISDAGTDAKIAKFLKNGIEILDFGIIEPGEIRKGISNLNQFNLIKTLSNQIPTSNSSLCSHHSISNTSEDQHHKFNGPMNWFKKIKTIGNLGSKRTSTTIQQPLVIVNEPEANEVVIEDQDGVSNSTGLEFNKRVDGYVWMVKKWLRDEAPESIVLIEWRKGSKPKPKKNTKSLGMINSNSNSNRVSSSRRHSRQFIEESEVMDSNHQSRPSVIQEEREEEEEEESDAEDSERPWHCEIVVINQIHHLERNEKRRYIGSFTPQPHHPRIIGKLTIPWKLERIYPDEDFKSLTVEEMKDLIVITSMWLIVREELGSNHHHPNQLPKLGVKLLNSNNALKPTIGIPSSSSSKNQNRHSISVFGLGNQNNINQQLQQPDNERNDLVSNFNKLLTNSTGNPNPNPNPKRTSLINWSKIGKLNP